MNNNLTMKEFKPYFLYSYDKKLIKLIMDKYKITEMDAVKSLVSSETYKLISDMDCGMREFGYYNIMDMYVAEKETGNPRNANFLRMDA